VDESLDLAAEAITTTAVSIGDLYGDEIILGLSGGKDSRVLAASAIAAGRRPRFVTNEDTAAEGEIARELMRILRDKRGIRPNHQFGVVAAPDGVLKAGLHERVARLQRLHDFQYPSSFTVRRPARQQLWDHAAAPSFSGAGGELATGYWYPVADGVVPEEHAVARLMSGAPKGVAAPAVTEAERSRIGALAVRGRELGLGGLPLIDYIYLVERVRRWYTSAYLIGSVTPFLSPGFVAASFALTSEQKRARLLHTGLIDRLVPEWSHVPFVSVTTGRSIATRVWDGDGVQAIADLLETAHGPIAQLVRREAVEKALTSAVHRGRADQTILQQFACLAVASETLEPGTVRPATPATLTRIMTPPGPTPERWPRLRWLKRTRAGRTLRRLVR
jgi:asparagine synthase (glutamine-hydrolysing)